MQRPRTIVVVAYGAPGPLAETLGPLVGESVVVVDNSSNPHVRAVAHEVDARYIDMGANRGFAAGVNVALREERSRGFPRDVLLLNPDAVLSRGGLDLLHGAFADPLVAAASPRLVGPDGTDQQVRWPFPRPAAMWREALGLPGRAPDGGFLVGAALLMRREALAEVGLLDERYFLYAEEADWQRRAALTGWRGVVVEDAVATHVGSGTSTDHIRRDALFHAGQETYVRRWFGPLGWTSYRAAAALGAAGRAVALRDDRRTAAARRASLYWQGPRRAAGLVDRARPLRIAHVVVTDSAAGTERYVRDVAAGQAAHGHDVVVVGGEAAFMREGLPREVQHLPGRTVREARRSLRLAGARDVVNTHLTAADAVGVLGALRHGGAVVSTRHIAARRGSSRFARTAAAVLERRIALEIFISDFVATSTGRPGIVLHNGVSDDDRTADVSCRQFLLAQRLEPEKDTRTALEAWSRSGLADDGWRLVVCGDGSERVRLEALSIPGIDWRGWTPHVAAEMLRSAALIASAPAEPLGLSVIEAMSVALPVIAADGGGHRESVGSSNSALMVSAGDAAAFAAAMRVLAAETAEQRRRRGEALRKVQRYGFSLSDFSARLDAAYARALA